MTLIEKVRRAYQYAPMPGIETDDASIETFLAAVDYTDEEGDGLLLGCLHPFHLNHAVLIGNILMIDGRGHGSALLDRFTAWAKARGADLISVSVADFNADAFFTRRDFRAVEHMFIRRL